MSGPLLIMLACSSCPYYMLWMSNAPHRLGPESREARSPRRTRASQTAGKGKDRAGSNVKLKQKNMRYMVRV